MFNQAGHMFIMSDICSSDYSKLYCLCQQKNDVFFIVAVL